MLDVVIIGAGPIGLFAAFNAGMRNLKGALIEAQSYVGGQLTTIYAEKPIYDIPGIKEIKAKDLAKQLYEQYLPFQDKIPLYLNNKFFEIERKEDFFLVKTANHIFETKTILLTVGNGGFNPRRLTLPGSDQYQNIVYFIKNIEDFANKQVVLLGGGDSALDWANVLVNVAKSTTLVHRRREFRAHDESIRLFEKRGTILTPYTVEELLPKEETTLSHLVLKQVEDNTYKTIEADVVIVNYGFLPSLIKYSNFNLEHDDLGLLIAQDMSTSLEGVYAAGNCVHYPGKLKTLASGLGEAVTAIHAINNRLFPTKNNLPIYSSVLMSKKK